MRVPPLALAVLALAHQALAQVPAGGEFQLNTYTSGSQGLAAGGAIDVDAAGNAVVVWSGNGPLGGIAVSARRFDATGGLQPERILVDGTGGNVVSAGGAGTGARGDFVVSWQDAPNTATDVFARRYDRTGTPAGSAFLVNNVTTFIQEDSRVSVDSSGRFAVVWVDWLADGGAAGGVFARLYDASGTPRGDQFLVNTYTTDSQDVPDVAHAGTGDFVVVWSSWLQDGSDSSVHGQRFAASGSRLGGEFMVNIATVGRQEWARVDADADGNFVVAWHDSGSGDGSGSAVMARLYDSTGVPRGPEFRVNQYTTGDQEFPDIHAEDTGAFVVVWHSRGTQDGDRMGIFGQRFTDAGARRGAEFRVNTYTTDYQFGPSIAGDGSGNFDVVWSSAGQDGHLLGVYGQRFGGLQPAALVVDTGGNRVLEPGEGVDVRPSWRNVNGAAQTFSGLLGAIAGPPGATYAITDSTGDYGTVANGATSACVDCYAVSVSNPA